MSLATATWENQIFTFGWNPYSTTISQCDNIAFGWNDNNNAAPNSTGPYEILVYSGYGQPLVIDAGFGNSFNWQATIEAGRTYMFGMKDVHGLTGGVSELVTINRGEVECNETSFPKNTLDYEMISTSPQCGKLQFLVKNGDPPYMLQIIPENHYPKILNFSSQLLEYVIDLQSNSRFFAVLSDKTGRLSMQGLTTVGPSNDASCITAAPIATSGFVTPTTYSLPLSETANASGAQSSGNHTGAVVGGVIGAIGLLVIMAIVVLVLRRKRRQTSVHVSDHFDLTSPVDQHRSFFSDPNTHATPWTPDARHEEEAGHASTSSSVPLMQEAPLPKSGTPIRPTFNHANSSGSQIEISAPPTTMNSPSPTLVLHDDREADTSSSSVTASGSQSRPVTKRVRSSVPSERTSNSRIQSASNIMTLTEDDVGVAIPPPPMYSER